MKVQNPVLKGFNPDPTMCYTNGKYYIATSTFQWYPGITIYESTNLVNWSIVSTPLTDKLDFDLSGIDDSAGIWAPNLVYDQGIFYLSYTIVKSATGVYYDMENYIIRTDDITKNWSKPIQVNSGCFDPSLFFDNQKCYLLAKIVDHRYEPTNDYIDRYSGIIIQELDKTTLNKIGDFEILTHGTGLGGEEGPQMFKRNDYYYLNIAEGGTEYGHQTTIMRSKRIKGPFEIHPNNPLLKSQEGDYLQKAGHSSFIQNDQSQWFISHLCSRPIVSQAPGIRGKLCCPLGRETAIQQIKWKDDWPYVISGPSPSEIFEVDINAETSISDIEYKPNQLPCNEYLMLRKNMQVNNYLHDGKLVMPGYDSLMSKFEVNLYGHRVESLNFETSVNLEYNPSNYLQMSGISLYYDTENYITIFVTHDEKYGRCIKVEAINHGKYSTLNMKPKAISEAEVTLKFIVDGDNILGYYNEAGKDIKLEFEYYSSYLSDDYILLNKPSFFTGMLCCFYNSDLTGKCLDSRVKSFKTKHL